jgi:thymidine kinase
MYGLILGPMKSGKTYELISQVMPYRVAGKGVVCIKPDMDTRNEGIQSRGGGQLPAIAVKSLKEAPYAEVIAVDEVHMFDPEDMECVQEWLERGATVFLCGLDTGYKAELFPVIKAAFELKPDFVSLHKSICDVCNEYDAKYTQVLSPEGEVYTEGLPRNLTEDGRYAYQSRCRECFVRERRYGA